jgi:hypothetical protein
MLIYPNESAGTLKFESIAIDGETKSNIVVSDLKVIPGQRYCLDLEFKTCTQNVEGGSGMNWSYAERKERGVVGIVADGIFIPNGNSFNTFLWDDAKINVVKVTQLVDGETIIKGRGSGVKKVSYNLLK